MAIYSVALMPASMQPREFSRRRKWTPSEDEKLRSLVAKYGEDDWRSVSEEMGERDPKQCRYCDLDLLLVIFGLPRNPCIAWLWGVHCVPQ